MKYKTLSDILTRPLPPKPWSEGEKIPWNDDAFSSRMLNEHLTQSHNLASRRFEIIDKQVKWIYAAALKGRPGLVLDMGCGPGLYAERLARFGCRVVGIDFSPASISYARETAAAYGLDCDYILGDLRKTPFGESFDAAIFLYGEFNVFRAEEAKLLLAKAFSALKPGGVLLIEPHEKSMVEFIGRTPSEWSARESGLFSEKPHLLLTEHFYDEQSKTATTRYFTVILATGETTSCAETMKAYDEPEYFAMLQAAGFEEITRRSCMGFCDETAQKGLFVLSARKP